MSTIPVRYLGWMGRDFARGPGLLILVAGALAVFTEQAIAFSISNGTTAHSTTVVGVYKIGRVFVLLATAGIVSRDMTDGYYRTIFARPVSPPLYYLQRWLLGGRRGRPRRIPHRRQRRDSAARPGDRPRFDRASG